MHRGGKGTRTTPWGRQTPQGILSDDRLIEPNLAKVPWTPESDEPRQGPGPGGPLIDLLIRETYKKNTILSRFSHTTMDDLRKNLLRAKRFILDASMSAFVADLSTVPFVTMAKLKPDDADVKAIAILKKNMEILTSIRHSAIPPFDVTWIEMEMPPMVRRLVELNNDKGTETRDLFGNVFDTQDVIPRSGWLFFTNGSTVIVNVFGVSDYKGVKDGIFELPFSFLYQIDDMNMPPQSKFKVDFKGATLGHGILMEDHRFGLINHVSLSREESIKVEFSPGEVVTVHKLLPEFGGTLRRAICLLAALGSIPKIEAEVRSPGGYLAKGQIRKYVPCTRLTLSLPGRRTTTSLAKSLIEQVHHRWHQVRSHWRVRIKSGGRCCDEANHLWTAKDALGRSHCTNCDAVRTWIVLPNGRGDRSLGVVTHDYAITRRPLG